MVWGSMESVLLVTDLPLGDGSRDVAGARLVPGARWPCSRTSSCLFEYFLRKVNGFLNYRAPVVISI